MKITEEKVEGSQAYLTIEVEPAEVEESMEKAYERLVKRTRIPGFRKGKAPRPIFERHVGRENLFDDALDILIPDVYKKAVSEKNIEAFAQPMIEITQKEPVILKAIVPLKPTVKLGDYKSIRLQPEPVNVTDELTDSALEQIRHQHSTWEPVERPVAARDLVSLDISSTIEGQPYINRKNGQYQVVSEFPLPIPGFPEALIGMKQDEEKEFKLKFPDDYARPELAGKEADFKVKILEVKQEKLPELNDDFAKQLNPEFKDVKELREKVTEDLKRQLEEHARSAFEDKVIEAVAAQSTAEYPPVMTEAQIDHLIRDRMLELETDARGLYEYLKSIKKTEKEFRDELKPLATARVVNSLVLGKVAEEEKITVSEDEVNAEIDTLVKNAAADKKDSFQKYLNTPESKESIHDIILTRKTVEKLTEIAKGSEDSNTAPATAEATQEEKK